MSSAQKNEAKSKYTPIGGESGAAQVAGFQVVDRDEVRDVDDGADDVVVQPVTLEEPPPTAGAQVAERRALHEPQPLAKVRDPLGAAAGLAADPEAPEQVDVD